jgi:hypothetical protein
LQLVTCKVKHELGEWVVMFLYLWVIFGLFGLHQSILMAEERLDFRLQGFAIINALILSKVMLVAEGLHFARGGPETRPLVVIISKSIAFALLFIGFHVLESVLVGVFHGKTIVASIPTFGGGRLQDIIALDIIVSISLVPFFAFREVSRDLGRGRLWQLLVEPRQRID